MMSAHQAERLNMIPDIFPPIGTWTDVYAVSGIAVGTRLQIQNKSVIKALIWEGDIAPPVSGGDGRHGYVLNPGDVWKTTTGIPGCWALFYDSGVVSSGRLCAQVYS